MIQGGGKRTGRGARTNEDCWATDAGVIQGTIPAGVIKGTIPTGCYAGVIPAGVISSAPRCATAWRFMRSGSDAAQLRTASARLEADGTSRVAKPESSGVHDSPAPTPTQSSL